MRNLIVCCDGTWNMPDDKEGNVPTHTNVARIFNALAEENDDGIRQLAYYHPGVGAEPGILAEILGNGIGLNLSQNIMSAYKWLATIYQPGDRVFFFGFSRGAYTVRSLAGMISGCGLLDLRCDDLSDKEIWSRVGTLFREGYREKFLSQAEIVSHLSWKFHTMGPTEYLFYNVPIHFLGVWDTVGALGIPDDLVLPNLLDDSKKHGFHDTSLSVNVAHARHAVAIDEMRASFTPTLWTGIGNHPDAKQMWFPGVHSDVGGGYAETGLSDGALQWMMDEARQQGLGFHQTACTQIRPNVLDVIHNSFTGIFRAHKSQPRTIPHISRSFAGLKLVHASAIARQSTPSLIQGSYRPTDIIEIGTSRKVTIYAGKPWNETGIFLEEDAEYSLSAIGEWLDGSIACGPDGCDDDKFSLTEIVQAAGTALGKLEQHFRNPTENAKAELPATRREENFPWFSLIGVIANGMDNASAGSTTPHQTFLIGRACSMVPRTAGYLYGFANDAWHFYGNNRGSVELQISRTK